MNRVRVNRINEIKNFEKNNNQMMCGIDAICAQYTTTFLIVIPNKSLAYYGINRGHTYNEHTKFG